VLASSVPGDYPHRYQLDIPRRLVQDVHMTTFTQGATVVTRRGKRGTVEGYNADGTVNVRFGGRVFPMREGQLVHEASYRAMTARRPNPNAYFLSGR